MIHRVYKKKMTKKKKRMTTNFFFFPITVGKDEDKPHKPQGRYGNLILSSVERKSVRFPHHMGRLHHIYPLFYQCCFFHDPI